MKLIIHCSDSSRKEDDDIDVIKGWHKSKGWIDVGYHFFIKSDGTIQTGRPVEQMGSHCKDHNSDSIGICLSGKDKFTEKQFVALADLVIFLTKDHGLTLDCVFPHRYFNNHKTCPNFSVKQFLEHYVRTRQKL